MINQHKIVQFYNNNPSINGLKGIKPIKKLDEIKKGAVVFIPQKDYFEVIKVESRKVNGKLVEVLSGFFVKGKYLNSEEQNLSFKDHDMYDFTEADKGLVGYPKIVTKDQIEANLVYRI